MKTVKLFSIIVILFTICACNNGQEEVSEQPPLKVQLVHNKASAPVVQWLQEQYRQFKPRTSTGQIIEIKLIEKEDMAAAEEISAGKIKSDFWISSSSTYIDYANSKIHNFGAKQVDCNPLFNTPIVAAVKESPKQFINSDDNVISLRQFLKKDAEEFKNFSISHTIPTYSANGLATFIEAIYISSPEQTNLLKQSLLEEDELKDNLKKLESFASMYDLSSDDLFIRAVQSPINLHPIVITTEQEIVQFNLKDPKTKLNALYPKEGSFWMDYSICRADADWQDPVLGDVYQQLINFLNSARAQDEFMAKGFRPANSSTFKAPLDKSNGIDTNLPSKMLYPPAPGDLMPILQAWQNVRRPAANIFIIDTSGSMQGEPLMSVKSFLTKVVDNMRPNDVSTLISFANSAHIDINFTGDKDALKKSIDALSAASGGALYEAVNLGFKTLSLEQAANHINNIVIITDGSDTGAKSDLRLILTAIKNIIRYKQLDVTIIGINRGDLKTAPLIEISYAAGGAFIQVDDNSLNSELIKLYNKM